MRLEGAHQSTHRVPDIRVALQQAVLLQGQPTARVVQVHDTSRGLHIVRIAQAHDMPPAPDMAPKAQNTATSQPPAERPTPGLGLGAHMAILVVRAQAMTQEAELHSTG